jgi:hypothetical protein
MSFLDEIGAEAREAGLAKAVACEHTAPIFDWLVSTFSFQGISDRVARDYMAKHGSATWSYLKASLRQSPSCPKLRGYWTYEGCRYDKGSLTCSEPEHIGRCPLPRPRLRNGRLNQTAYSLFLFVRDLADNNIVGWIDQQLETAAAMSRLDLEAARQESLIGPLRNVYGVSDKVLAMALSSLLMSTRERPGWFETGKSMIVIDTLVHHFLHRTGILHGCGKPHAYGVACYGAGGCAEIIRAISNQIDTRTINPSFPAYWPRWIQHAIWRFCAADGLNLCNGNRIDDRKACQVSYCQLYQKCQRIPLKIQ